MGSTPDHMAGFWREVPCGHPPDPIAARMPDGHLACHCGWGLDDVQPITRVDPLDIVPCDKCGCYVGVPIPETMAVEAATRS